MSLAAQQSLESHYVMHTFGRSPVEFVEGHGMKLTGDDGREYLDFLAGIGVCSLGHGNPAVLSALEAQTKKLMHVSNYFYIEQRGQVAALLSKLANDDVDGARVLADAIVAGDETTAAALGAPAADEQALLAAAARPFAGQRTPSRFDVPAQSGDRPHARPPSCHYRHTAR